MNLKKKIKTLGYSTLGIFLAYTLPLDAKAQSQPGTPVPSVTPPSAPGANVAAIEAASNASTLAAIIAAEEAAQQAATTAIIAAEEAAQQAASTATIAAEAAAQQASASAVLAAEAAAQQASSSAILAAEEAAQQASTTAILAAEEAAQQASTTATIAAEEAAQQASTTATIAAEEAAQQAATTATIAAEEAAQQASTTATIASEEAAQQAVTTANEVASEAAQTAEATATNASNTASSTAAAISAETSNVGAVEAAMAAAEETAHSAEAAITAAENAAQSCTSASLHFGSEAAHFTAPNATPVEIIVGGEITASGTITGGTARTITPGESLTAAELEAVEHVLLTGAQSLLLNAEGHAVGGHITLTSSDFHCSNELYVPEAVSLNLINFNSASPLTIANNASIFGSVNAFHDTHGMESVLNFGSLDVASGGLLSGGVPSIDLFGNYFASSALTLNVTNSVVNSGTISSPGSLAINAGTTISNAGLMTGSSVALNAGQGISNTGNIMATMGSVSLYSGSGSFTNSGVINAALGSINAASQMASNIAINNEGGTLSALDAINVRDESYTGDGDATLIGGDYLSDSVNIYSGHGTIRIVANEFTGTLNALANESHAYTNTDNFTLGTITNTGDPTFFNATGDITFTGSITVAEDFTAAARGNILDSAGGNIRIRAGDNTQGYDITLVAGANIVPTAGATPTTTVPGTQIPAFPAGEFIQISAPTAAQTGGNITLTNVRVESRAIGGAGARPGGNIVIAAYAGNNGQGNISLTGANNNAQLDSRGRSNAPSGSITVVGEGNVTPSRILANVGNGSGDTIVASATPIAGPSGTLRALPNGSIVDDATLNPANFTVGALQNGNITFNLNVNSRGNVLATTNGGNITVSNNMRTQSGGQNITLQTVNGNINLGAEVRSDSSVTVTSTNGNVARTGGRLRATNVFITATNGNIGTAAQRVFSRAGSGAGQGLTINTGGDAFINERDSVRLNASTIGGELDLLTNQANGFIRIVGDVSASGGATLLTPGSGIFRIDAGNTLSTTNQNISITADDYVGAGSLNAGTGIITLVPNANGQLVIFGAGGAGANFRIDNAELGRITGNTLTIGNAGNTGGISNTSNMTVPGTISNLVLTTGDNYSTAAGTQTIALGTATLTINANGIDTDTITGGATTVNFNSSDTLTFTGPTTLAAAGSSINATATNLIDGTGLQSAANINLTSTNNSIGTSVLGRVNIDGTDLTANAINGNVFLNELNSINVIGASAAGTTFNILAGNDISNSAAGTINGSTVNLVGTNGNINLGANTTASAGALTITSGSTNSTTIGAGVTAQGNSVAITTPSIINSGTVQSNTGDIDIVSNGAGNALNATLNAGSNINSAGDIEFNTAGIPGAITMLGGNGNLTAGGATPQIILNGGTGAVNANINQAIGCVEGTGNSFSFIVQNGDLQAGNITANNAITLQTNGTGGDFTTCGTITSTNGPVAIEAGTGNDSIATINHTVSSTNGSLTIQSNGASNSDLILNANVTAGGALALTSGNGTGSDVSIATGITASGASATTTTPDINLSANSQLIATTGDNIIQSNLAGSALTVDFLGAGSTIESTNGNIGFNTITAGNITVTGGPGNGLINASAGANNVTFGGGTVNVNVNRLNGPIIANNALQANINVTTAAGNIDIANIDSNGVAGFVANGGNINVNGPVQTDGVGFLNIGTLFSTPVGSVNIGNGVNTTSIGSTWVLASTLDMSAGNNSLTSTANAILIQGNPSPGPLTVNLGAGSSLNATGANGDIFFNFARDAVTITGGTNGLINANRNVNFNVNTTGTAGPVNVSVGQINGCIQGTGTSVSLTTNTGDLNIGVPGGTPGTLTSTAGNLSITANGGNVNFKNDASASGGNLIVTASTTGQINLQSGSDISGDAASLTAPAVTLANGVGSSVTANTGDLTIQSNGAGNALIVSLATNTSLVSTNGNVIFNTAGAPGNVTMVGNNGLISANGGAGNVEFNGGTVNTRVNQIVGLVTATNAAQGPITVFTQTGNLNTANIVAAGLVDLRAQGASVNVTQDITSTNNGVFLLSGPGAADSVILQNGADVQGVNSVLGGVLVGTGNLDLSAGNNSLTATNGNVLLQGFPPLGRVLTVSMGAGSVIEAQGIGDVQFNTFTNGQITINGAGEGNIVSANNVVFGGGANTVNVNVNQIDGCIIGTGTSIAIATDSGNLNIGTAAGGTLNSSAGNIDLTASGGNITFKGDSAATGGDYNATASTTGQINLESGADISGDTVGFITPALSLANGTGSSVTANTGDLNIQSNAVGNVLTVSLASNTSLVSTNANVNFNAAGSTGQITVSGPATGTISANGGAGNVNFFGGANAVNVNVNQIIGCVGGSGNPFSVTAAVGGIGIGNINTPGSDYTFIAPTITICGDITARDIQLGDVQGGPSGITTTLINGGANTVTSEGPGGITLNTTTLNVGDFFIANAAAAPINIQASVPANGLTVNFTDSTSGLTTNNGDVNFNPTTASAITVTGGPGNGVINAGNGTVAFNGGTNAVGVSLNQITASCIGGTGTDFSIVTAAGDLNVGNINANGNLLVQVLDPAGNISTCGQITNTLSTGTNQFLANTGAGTGNIDFGASVTTNGGNLSVQAGAGNITDSAAMVLRTDGAVANVNGGDIDLDAANIILNNGGVSGFQIAAEGGGGTGNGGAIDLNATNSITVTTNINARSFNAVGGSGSGGTIDLTSGTSDITVGILNTRSLANTGATANGGDITVNSGGAFTGNSNIRSRSGQPGSIGNGGVIDIRAVGNISLNGLVDSNGFSSGASNGGNITINSTGGSVSTAGAGAIASGGSATGTQGNVDIDAAANVNFGANVTTGGGSLSVTAGGNITDSAVVVLSTNGVGANVNGGTIDMDASNITINNGTGFQITAEGGGGATGSGGLIDIDAVNNVTISGFVLARSNIAISGSGTGGTIQIDTVNGNVDVFSLNVRSLGNSGANTDGGNITVNSAGTLIARSIIRTIGGNAPSSGDAGDITLNAVGNITLQNQIDARAFSANGNGGNIVINSTGGNVTKTGSNIDASGSGTGLAGTVDIDSNGTIALTNTSVIADGGFAAGTNGIIGIDAPGVITFTNVATVRANGANNARGGQITIQGSALNAGTIPTVVQASGSGSGDGGVIVMNATGNDGVTYNSTLAGGFQVIANGGNTGSGGSFTSTIGSTLTIQDNAAVSVAAGAGGNGNGGTINLTSGSVVAGVNDLVVNGNLLTDAAGAGTDGTVTLTSLNGGNVNIGTGGNATVRGLTSTVNSNNSINIGSASNVGTIVSTGGPIDFDAVTAVNVNSGSATGQSVDIMTPLLSMGTNGSAAITAIGAGSNVEIQSNAAGFGLTVNFNGAGNNSQIVSTNGNVGFNTTNAGAIDIDNNPGQGLIAADNGGIGLGVVTFNGGTNPVSVDVNQIRGCVAGTGNPFSVTASTGGFGIGNINTAGDFTFVAPDINLCGFINAGGLVTLGGTGVTNSINQPANTAPGEFDITGGTGVTLISETFNLGALTTATAGQINIQDSNAGAAGITVNFTDAASTLTATGAGGGINISTAGGINVASNPTNGIFNAGANNVDFAGGAGAVDVQVGQITAACTSATGTDVTIRTQTGGLNVGNISANGTLLIETVDAAGNIVTCGNIDNAGGTSTITAGSGGAGAANVDINGHTLTSTDNWTISSGLGTGTVFIRANGSVSSSNASANVTINGPTVDIANDAGAIEEIRSFNDININADTLINAGQVRATDFVRIDALAASGNLMVTNDGLIRSNTDDILFNSINAGGTITVTDTAGTGVAGRLQTETSNRVRFGDSTTVLTNANTVNVVQNQINGRVEGIGTIFTVAAGSTPTTDLRTEQITASSDISVTTAGDDLLTFNSITSTGGNINLSSDTVGNNHSVTIGDSTGDNVIANAGTVTITSGTAGTAAIDITNDNIIRGTGVTLNTPELQTSGAGALIDATNGNVVVQSNAGSSALNLALGDNTTIQSTTAGGNGQVSFNNTINGNITGTLNAAVSIAANDANGSVEFNSGGAGAGNIALEFVADATISANGTNGDINFNPGTAGQIDLDSLGTPGNGNLVAGRNIFFNGTGNTINATMNSIAGCIYGSGTTVIVNAVTGNLNIGAPGVGGLTATGGDLTITAQNGNITYKNDASASGQVVSTATTAGGATTTINAGVIVNGDTGIDLETATLGLLAGASLQTTSDASVINIQGNGGGGSDLQFSLADNAAQIYAGLGAAGAGASIVFNDTTNGAIATTSVGTGLLSANGDGAGALGTVTFNGGVNPVNVNVNTIEGCVGGSGTPFNVTAATGGLGIGNINTPGSDYTFIAPTITICGDITARDIQLGDVQGGPSGIVTTLITQGDGNTVTAEGPGGITLNTTTLNVGDFFIANAPAAPINVQASVPANGVTVNFTDATSGLTTNNGNITFNPTTAANVTITGGPANGVINAGTADVVYNGGIVSANLNQVIGCNTATNAAQLAFSLTTQAGDINLGNITATGAITVTANGGNVNVKDNMIVQNSGGAFDIGLTSTNNNVSIGNASQVRAAFLGSDVNIAAGTAGQLTMAGGNSLILAHTNVNIVASTIDMSSGSNQIAANVGNANIDRGAGGNPLNIALGSGSIITATTNVNFNATNNGTINLNGAGEGLVAGTEVVLNGTGGNVLANLDEIRGCIHGTANSISITTDNAAGDINVGTAAGNSLVATAGGMTLNSARDVIFKGGANSATALVDVDAVRDITVGSSTVQASVTSSGGNVDMDAGGAVLLERFGTSNITSTNGQVDIDAVTGITLYNNVSAGTNVNLTNGNSDILVGGRGTSTVTSGTTGAGDVTITATGNAADVSIGGDAGGQAGAILANGGNVSITSSGVNADVLIGSNGTGSITADNNITIDASNGDAVVVGSSAQGTILSNNGNVAITSRGRSNSGFHDLIVGRTAGAAGSSITATTGAVSLNAVGTNSINIGLLGSGAVSAGSNVTINSAAEAVSVGSPTVVGSVTSSGGFIDIDAATTFTLGSAVGSIIDTTAAPGGTSIDINAGSDVVLGSDVTATTTNTITSGAANSVTVGRNGPLVTASGTGITVNTSTLNVTSDAIINATTGNILVQGTGAGNSLNVAFQGANGSIVSTGGNVTFNAAGSSGAITVTGGPANGTIAADGGAAGQGNGIVTFNGGTNAVNVNVNEIRGCIGGSGDPFSIMAQTGVVNGNANTIGYGNITSNQDIVLTGPNVFICDDITGVGAGTDITVTSTDTANGTITQAPGAEVLTNNNITYTTTEANLNSTSTATNGVINVQGNTAGTNAITINFLQPGGTSALIATNGTGNNNINFNPIAAGQITITSGGAGNPNGLINAGNNNVTYNGNNGTNNDVTVNVNQIIGCNIGDGDNIAITTTNAAGDILVGTAAGGSLNATGTLTLNSARDVIFKGGANTANGLVDIDAGRDVIVADNAAASVTTIGNITVDAGDGVNIGNNAVGSLLSNNGNITINAAGVSGSGSNDLNIGTTAAASGSSVQATNGNVSLATTGDDSEVRVGFDGDGSVVAGGTVDITTAGLDSDIDVGDDGGMGSVTAGGDITFNASDGVTIGDDSLGTVTSNTGNISITANDDGLVIGDEAGANGSSVTATAGNVTLLTNGADTDIVIGDDGSGSVNALGTINVTTTGTNGDIKLGDDGAPGTVTAGGDITFAANDGVRIGNTGVGTVTSNTGNVSITAAGASGFPLQDLTIGVGAGAAGSSVTATAGSVSLTTTGTNSINVGVAGAGTVSALNNVNIISGADVAIGSTAVGSATATNGIMNISSGSGIVNIANNSSATANGNLNIDRPGAGALTVTMGTGASVQSTAGSVSFQQTGVGNEGQITVNGGTINSLSCIDYHVGNNDLLVNVNEIDGATGNRVLSSGANPTSISFTTQTGNINFCAGADLNTSSAAAGGPITINANNGMINLNGNNALANGGTGNGGAINISGSTGIVNGGNVSSNSTNSSGGGVTLNGGTGNIGVGNISSTGGINGGTTSVTAGGFINAGSIDTTGGTGDAGGITTNSGGITTLGNLIANSTGGNGGTINSTSGGNLTTGSITASSTNGNGGSFTGTANTGDITTGAINVSSANGAGGNVTTNSQNVMVGGGINANGGTTGGTILITTTDMTNALVSGGGGPNSINGNITANGTDGGRVNLSANGGHVVNGTVSANGTTGNGGVVVLQTAAPGTGPLNVVINGLLQATNNACTSGNVALNTGPGAALNATGGGTLDAGGNIVFGNADPVTGDPVAPPGGLLNVAASLTLQACGSIIFNGIVPQPPSTETTPIISGPAAPATIVFRQPTQQFIPFLNNRDQTRIIEGSVAKDNLDPGAKPTQILNSSKTFENKFDKTELARLISEGNNVEQTSEGFISINNGNIIFAPKKTIFVKVKEGQVVIPGGAVVLLSESGADCAIYDLHQTGSNGVKVVSEGKLLELHPGKMIFLSRANTSDFSKITHQCKVIGHRNPQHKKLSDDVRAFSVNFSIPSAIKKVQTFRHMMKSSDKRDKVIIKKLLMNAVLLKDQMPYQGPYMSTGHINP